MSRTAMYRSEYGVIFRRLAFADRRVLLLDYDGTIAPFSIDRDRAFPFPAVPNLLARIMTKCRTRLIIVSDRRAHDLIPLLRIDPMPEIWGSHGMQRIHPDGRCEEAPMPGQVLQAVAQAVAELENAGLTELIETKFACLAVHWRGLPASAILEIRSKAYKVLEPLASQADLLLVDFDGGIALRPRLANKGGVIGTVLSEIGPDAPVAYLGDDATDEDAFRALNGRGLTVRVGPKERFSAAQVWLRYPDEVIQFLTGWILACGGDH